MKKLQPAETLNEDGAAAASATTEAEPGSTGEDLSAGRNWTSAPSGVQAKAYYLKVHHWFSFLSVSVFFYYYYYYYLASDSEPAAKVPRLEVADAADPIPGPSGDPIPGPSSDPNPHPSAVCRPKKTSLMSLYDSFLSEHDELARTVCKDDALVQMQKYLQQPTITRTEEGVWKKTPFQFWEEEHDRFPAVAAVALKFLSAPSTSVESERLFSTTSNIVDEKRNRLLAKRAEMLIFLKKNLTKGKAKKAPLSLS